LAGTASGSCSIAENDSSSNNTDGSDVEIDILNDDDKEPKKLHDDLEQLFHGVSLMLEFYRKETSEIKKAVPLKILTLIRILLGIMKLNWLQYLMLLLYLLRS